MAPNEKPNTGRYNKVFNGHFRRNVNICPVTAGLPTKMTLVSFVRSCHKQREYQSPYCLDVCKGKRLPKELEVITLESVSGVVPAAVARAVKSLTVPTRVKEEIILKPEGDHKMANVKRAEGTCEMCGKKGKNLQHLKEKSHCSVCSPVWRAVTNKPEMVAAALVEAHGRAFVENLFGIQRQGVDSSVVKDIEDIGKTLGAELQSIRAELVEQKEKNSRLLREIMAELGVDCEVSQIAEVVGLLKQERDRLKELAGVGFTALDCNPSAPVLSGRDTILLDLAIETLAGKITGLDADKIQALRMAA